MERARQYHEVISERCPELQRLREDSAALSEQLLTLMEECRSAEIRADAHVAALAAIQPLIGEQALSASGSMPPHTQSTQRLIQKKKHMFTPAIACMDTPEDMPWHALEPPP